MRSRGFKGALPYLLLGFALLLAIGQYGRNMRVAGGEEGFDFDTLAQTVVMDDGRAKPLDAVARNALLVLYNKQRFSHEGEKVDAIVWLMDVISRPDFAHDYKVFRIDHADVIELLGLRPSDGADNKFFSYQQLLAGRSAVIEQVRSLEEKKVLSAYDRGVQELATKINLYESYAFGIRPLVIPPATGVEDAAWQPYTEVLRLLGPETEAGRLQAFYDVIRASWQRGLEPRAIPSFFAERVQEGRLPPVVFNASVFYSAYLAGPQVWEGAIQQALNEHEDPEAGRAYYAQLRETLDRLSADKSIWQLLEEVGLKLPNHADAHWLEIVASYRAGDTASFNTALAKRAETLSTIVPTPVEKASIEVFFNRLSPFYQAQVLNVLGFVLAMVMLYFGKPESNQTIADRIKSLLILLTLGLISWLIHRPKTTEPKTWARAIWLGMMAVLGTAFAVHTFGLLARMWITGRPPVTDLYSSAVLVGWACVGVCLLLEWFTRRGIGGIVATACGFTTLIIAHHLHLENGGDTMGPMRAVLDSNFWLATHVIVVTLGYSATFVAGMFAIIYIIKGMATPTLSRTEARQLTQMVYGTVCFALLLSFVGTVLGGIWADQSWGRFWGWDPKENGAVMIVIMNAIILHAKWGRLVRERGIMVLAVGGNIITAWSWFGTNQLGVGLHSYGFTDGTVQALTLFATSQMLIMAIALIVPTRHWWSFRKPVRTA